jgi:hypothetical protein
VPPPELWPRLLVRQSILVLALVCVVASLIAASCGSDNDVSVALPLNPNLVTNTEIRHYPRNSPQRALLIWFQSVQFRDQDAVRLNTTSRELKRVSRKALEHAVNLVGSSLGKPKIVSTRKSGKEAAVRIYVQSYVPTKAEPVLSIPRTFSLARSGRRWRVDDARYLVEAGVDILAQTRGSASRLP